MSDQPNLNHGNGRWQLEVILIYEDRATALRAKRMCNGVVELLAPVADVHIHLWRFDLFRESAWRHPALEAAARADVVVVSAHGRGVWPEAVSLWLVRWLELGSEPPPALVVSLDSAAKGSTPANQILAGLHLAAWPAGVKLFEHFGESVPPLADRLNKTLDRRALPSLVTPPELLHPADFHQLRHWGINE